MHEHHHTGIYGLLLFSSDRDWQCPALPRHLKTQDSTKNHVEHCLLRACIRGGNGDIVHVSHGQLTYPMFFSKQVVAILTSREHIVGQPGASPQWALDITQSLEQTRFFSSIDYITLYRPLADEEHAPFAVADARRPFNLQRVHYPPHRHEEEYYYTKYCI